MDRKLWEGEADALSVESSIDLLVYVEKDTPIILALHPNTHREINAAICQLRKRNKWSGLRQDACLLSQYLLNYLLHFLIIAAILYADGPIDTSGRLLAEVCDHTTA